MIITCMMSLSFTVTYSVTSAFTFLYKVLIIFKVTHFDFVCHRNFFINFSFWQTLQLVSLQLIYLGGVWKLLHSSHIGLYAGVKAMIG